MTLEEVVDTLDKIIEDNRKCVYWRLGSGCMCNQCIEKYWNKGFKQ